ncbi:hypothetical protein LSH36_349g03034 [Paralvinella palmiformis]|uniref:Uncharacterized protein n=1 Tax=Paralvinella palmiformis TaxID=53620 RepID=A0AAD9JF90_9ANNE|nr:hypothetical protein LSH36_349g03034 [Paralvinella palmiformis]
MRFGWAAIFGHVTCQLATVQDGTIEGIHCIFGISSIVKTNKGKTSTLPGESVTRFSRKHRNPHESVDPCRYGSVHYLKPTQEFDIDCVCNLLQNPIVLHNIYIHCQLVKKDNAIEILISIATQVESKK